MQLELWDTDWEPPSLGDLFNDASSLYRKLKREYFFDTTWTIGPTIFCSYKDRIKDYLLEITKYDERRWLIKGGSIDIITETPYQIIYGKFSNLFIRDTTWNVMNKLEHELPMCNIVEKDQENNNIVVEYKNELRNLKCSLHIKSSFNFKINYTEYNKVIYVKSVFWEEWNNFDDLVKAIIEYYSSCPSYGKDFKKDLIILNRKRKLERIKKNI